MWIHPVVAIRSLLSSKVYSFWKILLEKSEKIFLKALFHGKSNEVSVLAVKISQKKFVENNYKEKNCRWYEKKEISFPEKC